MSFESPVSVLYNSEGIELAVSQSQSVSQSVQPGILLAGSSSLGEAVFFKVTPEGALYITGSFEANVVFPLTQSVEIVASNTTSSVSISEWNTAVTASVLSVGFSTSFLTSSIANTISFQILPANPNRSMVTLYVDGNRTWYVTLGATSSPTAFTIKQQNNSFFTVPERYTGPVSVIANGSGGSTIYVTEVSL